MNKKHFILSVGAYFVVTMALAYPWHMLWFHDEYAAMGAFTRDEPIIAFGVLAIVLQAVVFAYFYPLFYRHTGGGHPMVRGVQFSLLLGLTVYTVMVFATAAKIEIEPVGEYVAFATAFQFCQFTLVGIALGWIHGRLT